MHCVMLKGNKTREKKDRILETEERKVDLYDINKCILKSLEFRISAKYSTEWSAHNQPTNCLIRTDQ